MTSSSLGRVIAITMCVGLSSVAYAQPKNRGKDSAGLNDKNMDKQMEWEKKVMGDDSAKAADMRKIAAAQKLADAAAKNPPPVQAPKQKDPNKEGVRAKQEAAIGLPIASDQDTRPARKSGGTKKAVQPASADDALGALVASSLAEEKGTDVRASGQKADADRTTKGSNGGGAKGKGRAKATGPAPSTLDQMFATSK